jgi:aspartate/methionine/tyrosine aminotransferase
VRFPLADWIDSHAEVKFNLAQSGMHGTVRHPYPTAAEVRAARDSDLVDALARRIGVIPSRVFLAHGASEGNALVSLFLARRSRRSARRCRVRFPEYPPLWGVAEWAGLRVGPAPGRVPLAVVSQPRNPEGDTWDRESFEAWADGADGVLVDETFRELTADRSRARQADPRVWVTGTFTKAFGGDDIRVGWVVAPPADLREFARFHGIATDEIPPYSVAAALRTLREAPKVLGSARRVFERNRADLATHFPGGARIRGPTYFDRVPLETGDSVARRCLASSVLVCSGRFFRDPAGVRLCLTRRTFPRDLAAYLKVRTRARGHSRR